MFKLILVVASLCSFASAGYLGGPGYLGGHGYVLPSYHEPAIVAAAPIVKSYAPIVKTLAPVATSYANTYKVSTKSVPVVHSAVYAAPAVSTYHGSLGYPSYGLGYGHGYGSAYGHGYGGVYGNGYGYGDAYGYGHSLYH